MSSEVTIPDLDAAVSPIPQNALLEISNSGLSEKATIAQIVASGQTPWTQTINAANNALESASNIQTSQVEIINPSAGDNPTITSNSADDTLEFSGDIEIDGSSIIFGDHFLQDGWSISGDTDTLLLTPPPIDGSGTRTLEIITVNPAGSFTLNHDIDTANTELFWYSIAQGVSTSLPAMTHIAEIPVANDSGNIAVQSFVSRRIGIDPIQSRTLFSWSNNNTTLLTMDENGIVNFISPPTISDFTNSSHDHSDDVNGGNIVPQAIPLTSAEIIVGNEFGEGQAVFMSGDALIDNLGELTIQAGKITLAKLATGTAGGLIGYDGSGNPTDVAQGTTGQILTSNGTGLATFVDAPINGIVTINGDDTAAQVLVGTDDRLTVNSLSGTTTFDLGSDVVTILDSNTYGAFLQNFAAASLRIPISATPTIAVDGDFGIDSLVTDFTGGVLEYWSSVAFGVVAMPITEFTTPTDGDVITYDEASDTFLLGPVGTFSGNLSDLVINADKEWASRNITNLGLVNLRINDTPAVLELEADHTNPNNGDQIGELDFIDDNLAGTRITYGKIRTVIEVPTAGIESAEMFFQVQNGSGLADFIVFNKTGSNQVEINKILNLDNNNIINSGTINTIAIPGVGTNFLTDTATQDIQSKTFLGTSPNKFEDNALVIQNVAGDFDYIVQSSAITAAIAITLPLLLANDIFVFEAFTQNLTNKTLDNTNSIAADAIDSGTLDNARLSAQVVLTDQANTWSTGIQNFTAASIRMPINAAPTVAVDGDFAFDNNVAEFTTGLIKFFITEEQAIVSMPIIQFSSPLNGAIPTYNTTTNEFEMVVPPTFGDVSSVGLVDALSIAVFDDATGKLINEGGTTLHPSIDTDGRINTPTPLLFNNFAGTIPGGANQFIVSIANDLIINADTEIELRISATPEVEITNTSVTIATNNLILTDGNISFSDVDQEINDLHQINFNGAAQTGTEADNAALNLAEGDFITWEGVAVSIPNFIRFTQTDVFNLSIGGTLVLSLNAADMQFPTAGTNILNINGLKFVEGGGSQITGIATDGGILVDLENGDDFRIDENGTTEYKFDDAQLELNGNGLQEIGMCNFNAPGTALTITTSAITVSQTYHTVDTSAGTTSITTINGGDEGDIVILKTNSANSLDFNAGGNLETINNAALDSINDIAVFIYNGTDWLLLSISNNG